MGSAVEEAVNRAADFIDPYMPRRHPEEESPSSDYIIEHRGELVARALEHIQTIHKAIQILDEQYQSAHADAPYDGSLVGVVYALLDLIASQGILPSLSPGAVFSQRPRSALIHEISVPSGRDAALFVKATTALLNMHQGHVSKNSSEGIAPLVTQRSLPDIVSSLAELGFSPHPPEDSQALIFTAREELPQLLENLPTSRLLPLLTAFLQQEDLPAWFRAPLVRVRDIIPLREHGIRHIIEFLSLAHLSQNSQAPPDISGRQSQMPIPLEAITHVGQLLAKVPSGLSPDDWFSQLAPQLLALLDSRDGLELSKAAGQIISQSILSSRKLGSPGSVGWTLFVSSLHLTLQPGGSQYAGIRTSTSDMMLVPETELLLALKRLSVIASTSSHPSLTSRLLRPVILSLWGLLGYAETQRSSDSQWTQLPRSLLARYMNICCNPKVIDLIARNLFWDGEDAWTYGPGSNGGIEIRQRKTDNIEITGMNNLLSRVEQIAGRTTTLVGLLNEANIDDDVASTIFLSTAKRWLGRGASGESTNMSLVDNVDDDVDPLTTLSDAKLSEALATKFRDKFARSPRHIIELVDQLLQDFVLDHKKESKALKNASRPSRANLGTLAAQGTSNRSNSASALSSNSDAEELASFAISLLITVLASPEYKQKSSMNAFRPQLLDNIQYLAKPQRQPPISPTITNAASNLLQIQFSTVRSTASDTVHNPLAAHHQALQTACKELTSSEPPNRAWALSTIRGLITNPTTFPLIDIPSTTHMILQASLADPESYVYTAAIPVLVDLSIRATSPTLRIIVDAFVDVDENSLRLRKEEDNQQALDFRLRVGEVLHQIVSSSEFWLYKPGYGTAHFNAVKLLTESTLGLASRRGQRHKTLSSRTSFREAARREREEGEAAWGGPIPNLLDPYDLAQSDPTDQADREALSNIVQGWQDTGIEEDIRIRTSALSILGTILELRVNLLSQAVVDVALQTATLILVLERSNEKSILRRAAALVALGLLKALDNNLESSTESTIGLHAKQEAEIERVMTWVRSEDGDALTKGHADNVIEGLETLRLKRLYKVRGAETKPGVNLELGLEGGLRGLDVKPNTEEEGRRGKKFIVEEVD